MSVASTPRHDRASARTRSGSRCFLRSTRLAAGLVLAAIACGGPPERNPFGGTAPVGTIGSGPVEDDDDATASSSDDDGGGATTTSAGDDGASASATQGASDSATTNPTTAGGGESGESGSGDPVLDACLEIATDACQQCACNLCLDPLYACQQDPGCVAMRDCAEQYGCQGADCLEPCGAVVDMYGGPFGASGALALALSDCLVASCASCF
ncbi:MAG: hypothetical protein IPK74_10115 [Deltaproteobacteria bacterium]|nr:hypothetical protein [Deltaproteobacteria bacterium]